MRIIISLIIKEAIALAAFFALTSVFEMFRKIMLRAKRTNPKAYALFYNSRYWILGVSFLFGVSYLFSGHLSHDARDVDDFIARLSATSEPYSTAYKLPKEEEEEDGLFEHEDEFDISQLTAEEMEEIDDVLPKGNLRVTGDPSEEDIDAFDSEMSKFFWLKDHDPVVKGKFRTDKAMVTKLAKLLLWRNQYRPKYKYDDPPLAWRLKQELGIRTGLQIKGR